MRLQQLALWEAAALFLLLGGVAHASIGDRRPEFKRCVKVCIEANCGEHPTPIPLVHRLLLWDCPSECDYTCQHIVTDERLARPYIAHRDAVNQFHGKWPFYRFLGIQEPFSVLFSLLNFYTHWEGLEDIRVRIPASYPMKKYYIWFGYVGLASWAFSMLFHTRDFPLTEKLDYFGAGANVLYGLYYAPIRIFKLWESPRKRSGLRAWTFLCGILYLCHVCYLSFWSWDYIYNMAANVTVGAIQNLMWLGFSWHRYQNSSGRIWLMWPGFIVACITAAMSMELFDFAPWWGMIDAHSLWHLGTVAPTWWWYKYLIKDAHEDYTGTRLKQ